MEQLLEIFGETSIIIIGFLLIAIGFFGSIAPALPGPPIALVSIFLVHYTINGIEFEWFSLIVLIVLTIFIALADYFVPILGTKKFGGSKYGVRGSTIGLFVAVFMTFLTSGFGFILLLFGPFVGAFLGEKYAKNNNTIALRSAIGSFLGFLAGTIGKLFVVTLILISYFYKVIIYYF